jgi:hypothetical protein
MVVKQWTNRNCSNTLIPANAGIASGNSMSLDGTSRWGKGLILKHGSQYKAMTTTKAPFHQYTPRSNGNRSLEEATSEIQREMDVRRRLFDRWVSEGKMSWTDANDRMERHMSALKHLIAYSNLLSAELAQVDEPISTPLSLMAQDGLDTVPTAQAA